ncbi:hypothetical protein Adt_21507 [Abeliophyllum distichum]|uniref:Uncharacterized protein n=1 Tax=Abeliophyllum distichum TaxID=126358 RepID=A0ABD1SZT0_9LAMI
MMVISGKVVDVSCDSGSIVGGLLPEVSPSIAEVRPIQGVSAMTGEELAIVSSSGGGDLGLGCLGGGYAADDPSVSGRWAAIDVPSVANEADLENLRKMFHVPSDIEFHVLGLTR